MTTTAATAALIAKCIRYEESERDASAPEDRHYWDGWDRDAVRQGHPVAVVTTTSPGLGRTTIVTAHLMIKLPDGTYATVRDGYTERVGTRQAARRNGLVGYAHRLAAKLYGADVLVEHRHQV